jgi:site-specific recombinase XerD
MLLGRAREAYDLSKTGVSPATRRNYLQRLGVLIGYFGEHRDVATISKEDLLRWQRSLEAQTERYSDSTARKTLRGGLSPATIRTYVKEAYALFDFLQAAGVIDASPALALKLPPTEESDLKYIRDDDLDAMLTCASHRPRDYAILLLLADTGMRAGELCTLTLDRLDLKRQIARVKGKAKRFDDSPFVDTTRDALQAYLDVRPPTPHKEVFLSRTREPLSVSALRQLLSKIAAAAKVTGPHNPHAFRHGAARAVLLAGGTLVDVKEKLHHTSLKVTEIYAHLSKDEQHQRLDRFSPVRRIIAHREEQHSTGEQVKLGKDKKPLLRLVK